MSEVMDAFWQAPPMARTLATAILITSIGVYFQFLPFAWIYFEESRLFRIPPEVWRLATNFLVSGPKIGMVMDPWFVYQYLSQLETSNPRFPRKEDVMWYLITVGGIIITLNRAFLGGVMFLQALIIALCYTGVQDLRGVKMTFFFFQVPAQTVPYCIILATMVSSGSPAAVPEQLTGIIAAHLYDFLTRLWPEFGGGPNLLSTPKFMSRLVTTPRIFQREYGTAVRPVGSGPGSGDAGRSTGASTGSVLPDSWKTRGSGQRLG